MGSYFETKEVLDFLIERYPLAAERFEFLFQEDTILEEEVRKFVRLTFGKPDLVIRTLESEVVKSLVL